MNTSWEMSEKIFSFSDDKRLFQGLYRQRARDRKTVNLKRQDLKRQDDHKKRIAKSTERPAVAGRAEPRFLRRALQHAATLMYPV